MMDIQEAIAGGGRMAKKEKCEAEKLIEKLKSEGWKEQVSGTIYSNGTIATNLLKNSEVVTIMQQFFPDEEFIEQEWPGEQEG